MKAIVSIRHWRSVGLLMLASAVCWAQKPELVVQTGHSAFITSLTFSPDGKMLASASADNTIKLWEVDTGRQLRAWPSDDCISLVFSADGKMLASGSLKGSIKVWDLAAGQELRDLTGHSSGVNSVGFSPDGKTLASGSTDSTIRLWEVATGRELHMLRGHSGSVNSVEFDPNGRTLASGGSDKRVKFWEVSTGRELGTLTGHSAMISAVRFSADGRSLASGGNDGTKLWDVATGDELRTLSGRSSYIIRVAFSTDGRTLISDSLDGTIKLWDVDTGRELRTFKGHSDLISSIEKMMKSAPSASDEKMLKFFTDVLLPMVTGHSALVISTGFSADGKILASGSLDYTIKLLDVDTGRELRSLTGHSAPVSQVALTADRKTLARGSLDYTIKLWEVATGRELRTLTGHSGFIGGLAFSSDGKTLASASMDMTIKLWDVATGRELHTLTGIPPFAFSADGKTLASGGPFDRKMFGGKTFGSKTIEMWDVATGRSLRTLSGHSGPVRSIDFSADGKILASGGDDKTIKLWEAATGRELSTLSGHSDSVRSVVFSADGKTLASASSDKTTKIWEIATGREALTANADVGDAVSPDRQTVANIEHNAIRLSQFGTGRELHRLTEHSADISSVAFSADGKVLISGSLDGTVKLWRMDSGELLVSVIALDETDWAVVGPDGRFDASPGAQKLMHWMVGNEPIELEQLKERYYEPGLLAKILGLNKEPLRDVSKFKDPKLYPGVEYQPPAKGSNLTITLKNRGGGIGRVQVFVNGKEFLADARDERLKQNPNVPKATINIDVSKARGAVSGNENQIRVVAWNVENYISSRGPELVWTPEGSANRAPPEVYAIIGGISNYSGAQLNLNFAAKDAVDIANAIELGAKRLFGADKVHLTLLSTAQDPRAISPTKDNFTKAFKAASKARPSDILIVYLAGHGITLQRGSDTYCYLTQEARTTDSAALSDSAVRKQETITSEELVEWVKQIPANKQVIMLDTCAAGAAQAQLKLVDKREASGDAIRAIDRAKDRTGSYILMGSAADAVSYEASQYGQGLLTYALLKGMKGAALRNDEFIDVSKLFQFARDEVEQLAKNIGGIQKPIVFAPKDDSFEVGQLKSEDKLKISLAAPKPMILRPRLLDAQADDDTLDLMKVLRARLRDESFAAGRGASQAVLVFVDDEEFPGGVRPTGRYVIDGNKVTVTLRLRRDGVEIANSQVTGTKDDVPGLAAKIVEVVKDAIRRM